MDQGSTWKGSAVHNSAPTVTKFCVMWEGLSLPHDTKFGNCWDEIVDRRVIFTWSLIHGSSWLGLINAEPGPVIKDKMSYYHDGLVQERCNSSALAMELRFLALTHRPDLVKYHLWAVRYRFKVVHWWNSPGILIHLPNLRVAQSFWYVIWHLRYFIRSVRCFVSPGSE